MGLLVGRYTEGNKRDLIDATVALWKANCLLGTGSLTQAAIVNAWTLENVQDLYNRFTGKPLAGKEGGGQFATKWAIQLDQASPEVRLVAAEMLLIHFLFPGSVSQRRKVAIVRTAIDDTAFALDPTSEPYRALAQEIGNPGPGFNLRRDLQIGLLIGVTLRLKKLTDEERQATLDDPWKFDEFVRDSPREQQREMMHILLHLMHPETFERIASATHKSEIADSFKDLLEADGDDETNASVDRQLLKIRQRLQNDLMPDGNVAGGDLDFYYPPLRGVWQPNARSEGVGDVEALEWKKQLILYGPPGTSKTYTVSELARTLITREAVRTWGAKNFFDRANQEVLAERLKANVEWVQLHPAYGYAEFIRGLRLNGDTTRYEEGLLPKIIRRATNQGLPEGLADLPFVLVLDEINRTDLSAMLGEAFSLLERHPRNTTDKRETGALLPGINADEEPIRLVMPNNLFIIGTMNEIDQSVETLDYALRRRFLWRECPFDREILLDIVQSGWGPPEFPAKFGFDDALEQLEEFAARAQAVNDEIVRMPDLGKAYQIGHTYFAEITFFLSSWLRKTDRKQTLNGGYLWTRNGKPRQPLIDLWTRSIRPLLEQYLSGTDEREQSLKKLESIYFGR